MAYGRQAGRKVSEQAGRFTAAELLSSFRVLKEKLCHSRPELWVSTDRSSRQNFYARMVSCCAKWLCFLSTLVVTYFIALRVV